MSREEGPKADISQKCVVVENVRKWIERMSWGRRKSAQSLSDNCHVEHTLCQVSYR